MGRGKHSKGVGPSVTVRSLKRRRDTSEIIGFYPGNDYQGTKTIYQLVELSESNPDGYPWSSIIEDRDEAVAQLKEDQEHYARYGRKFVLKERQVSGWQDSEV